MSYCRFSSDGFQCDVYVYESDAGWITHVAANRPISDEPPPTRATHPDAIARMTAEMDWLKTATRIAIGLWHDRATYVDHSPAACAKRLEDLRSAGYNVPQYAIDNLYAEAKETNDQL